MDVSGYDCSFHNEEKKNIKLDDSYAIPSDSGYDSIYHGCSSVSMEKSFCNGNYDSASRRTPDRTPSKRTSEIHVSTPKNSVTVKRNLYSSHANSISKRRKSGNCENDRNSINASIVEGEHYEHLFIIPCQETSFRYGEISKESSNQYQYDEICFSSFNNQVFDWKHSTLEISKENNNENLIVPERPKKSKRCAAPVTTRSRKKLEIAQKSEQPVRTYCNGTSYVNIICKLEQFPDILESIFNKLSNKDLLNMSFVSKNFNRIIMSNRKVRNRIQCYLNVKENRKEPIRISVPNINRQPFGQFNRLVPVNKSPIGDRKFCENQSIVQKLSENETIVKCPRCGKSSIVSNPLPECVSQRANTAFQSQTENHAMKQETVVCIGRCTSIACKFEFCPKCLCEYHPEQKCKISQPESPSKLVICKKKSKLKTKPVGRVNAKKHPLRRLCFS